MNRLQFAAYLRHTLIPDFHAADMDATAEDFETALQFLCADVEAMYDARKALLAASSHLVPSTNAAALVAASIAELGQILDTPATRPLVWALQENCRPDIQADIVSAGDYIISCRAGLFVLSYRPQGEHVHLGNFLTLEVAKYRAETHHTSKP